MTISGAVVGGRAAEEQREKGSFILRDCLHGTALDVAFATPRGFRELCTKSLDAALRLHEWLEEDRVGMLLRAKKAALVVSARAEREDEGAAEALAAAVAMLRACCDGAWRRQWTALFYVCFTQLAFCLHRLCALHEDGAAGNPWNTFARASLQLLLLGSAPPSCATRAADARVFRSMALAALRGEAPSSCGSRTFVYGMRAFVDVGVTLVSSPRRAPGHAPGRGVVADAAASATREVSGEASGEARGEARGGTFFVGDAVTCACALDSKVGLPISRGTFAMRFVRAASGNAAFAAGRAAVAAQGRARGGKHASARPGKLRSPTKVSVL